MKQASRHGLHRPPTDVGADSPLWRRDLRDAIASRVLPRIAPSTEGEEGRHDDAAARLVALALAGPGRLTEEIETLRAGAIAFESLLLEIVAPAARRLGDLWLADRIGFLDVTAAVNRLQALVRALEPPCGDGRGRCGDDRRILLASAPGEHHVFGLSMVATFFRRAGWSVAYEPRIPADALYELIAVERFAFVGLSAAGDRVLADLSGHIAALRRSSLDREVVMLVGGPAFVEDPGLGRRVGADAAPRDAAEAVGVAERLSAKAPVR